MKITKNMTVIFHVARISLNVPDNVPDVRSLHCTCNIIVSARLPPSSTFECLRSLLSAASVSLFSEAASYQVYFTRSGQETPQKTWSSTGPDSVICAMVSPSSNARHRLFKTRIISSFLALRIWRCESPAFFSATILF